jgi:alanine racemase
MMVARPIDRAGAVLSIDLGGIAANWHLLTKQVAPASCAAVVKADAYGLGAARVGAALAEAGCRFFFTATLDEAIALRAFVPKFCEIAVLNGLPPGCSNEFVTHRLIPVLNHPGELTEWAAAEQAQGLPAVLHLDTGMARLGLTESEFYKFISQSAGGRAIRWRAVISHLACAETPAHPMNAAQRQRFCIARQRLGSNIPASLSASCGIFLGRGFHFDLVRPGAALYGVNPVPGHPNPMRQIVRLEARILQVREVARGESVGYGATHVMAAPGRLATVAVGYADGWPRSLSGRSSGRIGDARVPLVGRISMDLAVFDVSCAPALLARPGGAIELLGDDYGVDAVAADAGTIGYEILTALGWRYHRCYVNDAAIC